MDFNGQATGETAAGSTKSPDSGIRKILLFSESKAATAENPIPVTVNFISEPYRLLKENEIVAVNARIQNIGGNGEEGTFDLVPTDQGKVTVQVFTKGSQDGSVVKSNILTRTFDSAGPSSPVFISLGSVPNSVFKTPVFHFTSGVDLHSTWLRDEIRIIKTIGNQSVSNWTFFESGNTVDALNLISGESYFAEFRSIDQLGNIGSVTQSSPWIAQISPITPTLATAVATPTALSSIPVTVSFNYPVINFTPSDLDLTNATVNNFQGSGNSYSFNLQPTSQGSVSVGLAAGKAVDFWGNYNVSSNLLTLTYDTVAPVAVLADTPLPTDGRLALNATVLTVNGVTQYRYKLGLGSIDCASSTGYSSNISQLTPIAADLSAQI